MLFRSPTPPGPTLASAVAPVARSWTKMSAKLFTSPATRFRAVLWNAGGLVPGSALADPSGSAPLAVLLVEPFTALGSALPELDASLAGHAVVGRLSDHLWSGTRPTAAETEHLVAFCLRTGSRPEPTR